MSCSSASHPAAAASAAAASIELPPHSLVHGDYSKALHKGLHRLWRKGLMLDYTIKAEDKAFRVHRLMLASFCDYFEAAFRSGMVEVRIRMGEGGRKERIRGMKWYISI